MSTAMPVLPLYASIVWRVTALSLPELTRVYKKKYKHVTLLPTEYYSEPNLNKLSAMFLVN